MASKTAARSATRQTRSKAPSRGGARPARPPARRKPARRHPSPVATAGTAVGRGMRAGWLMLAKGAGSTARSVGRARELEPGHRRDGIALALLGLAVVVAASSWFDAARPVGAWIDTTVRIVIGSAVVLVPIVLATIGVILMRSEPDPESRPRLILGFAMVALPALGLWHLWSGAPQDPTARQHAAGFVGFVVGGPLSDGVTPWIAAPLLFIGVLFGLLLVTGTTIREVPAVVRDMFTTRWQREYDDEYDDYADEYDDHDGDPDAADDFSDGYYDDADPGRDDAAWPTANQPTEPLELSLIHI
ncbi:DNA translocase FtsK 4TM domain-containing protein, partial [Mycolicibacterium austroafricanum]|uniref:DNA translocase FtsK 4TM domain-containing protein n=1 Tax=Mycolicibacterium austroafricanum TaxID=39687 RepID=UPI001CA3857D